MTGAAHAEVVVREPIYAEGNVAPVFSLPHDASSLTLRSTNNGIPTPPINLTELLGGQMWDYRNDQWEQNPGLAAVALDVGGNGTVSGIWQYRMGGTGNSWNDLDTASENDALLLDAMSTAYNLFLRFSPSGGEVGQATVTVRAWDRSDGLSSGQLASTDNPIDPLLTFGGSPTAFSADVRVFTAQVDATNQRPGLPATTPLIEAQTSADRTASYDYTVSTLVSDATDPDGDDVGLGLTSVDDSDGWWEYSLDGDSFEFLDASTFSYGEGGEILLLPPSATLRYTPYQQTLTEPQEIDFAFTFRTWDQSAGEFGFTDTFQLGNSISSGSESGRVVISPFANSPPTWIQPGPFALPSVDADATDPEGATLESLIGGAFSDLDGDEPGVAIVGMTGNGTWQHRTESIGSWTDIDISESDALLLATSESGYQTWVRYVPGEGESNDTFALTVYAWDRTEGLSGSTSSTLEDLNDAAAISDVTRQITVSITAANQAPEFITSAPGTLAVAGQPYEALVSADDPDGNGTLQNDLQFTGKPDWLSATRLSGGRWRLHGTPPEAAGQVTYTIRAVDSGSAYDELSASITVLAAETVELDAPLPEVSTAADPIYGAIAPGSTAGFQTVNSTFGDLFPSRARGLWWLGGYSDLPTLPSNTATSGVFIATTVARTLSLTAAQRPAPFAVALPTGVATAAKWTFFGIPPLALNSEDTGVTSHPWSAFRLETPAGLPVTDPFEVVDVLGSGSGTDEERIQPYRYDSASRSYVRADTISSGVAYWIPNFGESAHRLVRTADENAEGRFGAMQFGEIAESIAITPFAASAASATPPVRAGPPAPPTGTPAATPAAESGSCGVGGLAGLLLAMFAMVGLRRRA